MVGREESMIKPTPIDPYRESTQSTEPLLDWFAELQDDLERLEAEREAFRAEQSQPEVTK